MEAEGRDVELRRTPEEGLERPASPSSRKSGEDIQAAPPKNDVKSSQIDISDRLRNIQNAALHFAAHASNETLGMCAVGLCASTYFVLGRVGLVLIGAVGGVVLHATWEGSLHGDRDDASKAESLRRRREQALEIATRAMQWREEEAKKEPADTEPQSHKIEPSMLDHTLDFSDFQPETGKALKVLTDAIVRDYVKWWYSPLLPADETFPAACRQTLNGFVISFSNHVSRKRTADPFLDFIANSTSILIVFLNELSNAVRASPNQNVGDAINTYLQYAPDSSLANVLDDEQQQRKLNIVAEEVLQAFLESKTYNCGPARGFLHKVLADLILRATVVKCSRPEWINDWIVYLLEDGEPEIMNAIDAGVEHLEQGLDTAQKNSPVGTDAKRHARSVSRAEEAMQEAMREAQKINEMIAEEDARRKRGEVVPEVEDTASSVATDPGIPTPTSSDGDRGHVPDMIFDHEGNAIPSGASSPMKMSSPVREKQPSPFTNFDQIATQLPPTAIPMPTTDKPPPPLESMLAIPLTLHNALITILDLGTGNDKVSLRQKPNDEMMIQIEPASGRYAGWMVTRRYSDYEGLHETLRRIAVVSGVPEFAEFYPTVPAWKGKTRQSLIDLLEGYLKAAVRHERLAESEAMKKFLDKSTGLDKIPVQNRNVLSQGAAALDNVGKGFVTVIGQGGKGIAGGGKAVLGGVQGVFGAVATGIGGPKKATSSRHAPALSASATGLSSPSMERGSIDLPRSSTDVHESPRPPLISRESASSIEFRGPEQVAMHKSQESLSMPTVPSKLSNEYVPLGSQVESTSDTMGDEPATHPLSRIQTKESVGAKAAAISSASATPSTPAPPAEAAFDSVPNSAKSKGKSRKDRPITDEETRITVDLMFAIITSTYSLSSAWTIRLSLLTAAKTFLLRPNNPQLDSIRNLLQDSLVSGNTSDAAMAAHILKLRENSLPTEEELAKWPAELTSQEKEDLRIKARKLLVERGMPQALTSVMGQAASGEALGKVFDCLQQPKVARGLVFALMLQAIRAVVQ